MFVNAGIKHADVPVGEVTTESFTEVMVTNALSPMRVGETLGPLVTETGTIAIMSSKQGQPHAEHQQRPRGLPRQQVRAQPAHAQLRGRDAGSRTLLLLNPGWARTGFGGPDALLSIDESIPGVVDAVEARASEKGLHFVDHQNRRCPGDSPGELLHAYDVEQAQLVHGLTAGHRHEELQPLVSVLAEQVLAVHLDGAEFGVDDPLVPPCGRRRHRCPTTP